MARAAQTVALSIGPVAISTDARTTARTKAALVAEVLAAYLVTQSMMRRLKVVDLVAAQRAVTADPGMAVRCDERATWRLAWRLGRIVDRTLAVLPTDARCLMQSLVLLRMLARRGIDTTLVIGARSQSQFEAHAWIEYQGHPVLPVRGFDEARLLEM